MVPPPMPVRAPRLSTRFGSCSPNLWISEPLGTAAGTRIFGPTGPAVDVVTHDYDAVCLCARTPGGRSHRVDERRTARPARADAGRGAARRRRRPDRATARVGQADRARATRPPARPGVVRRTRRVRHPPRDRIRAGRATTSWATASSPATGRSTAGSSSSSARTSRSSAVRCPRRTPRRSARSWISR